MTTPAMRELLLLEHQLVADQLIAALLARMETLRIERDSYREIAQVSIEELSALTAKHDRLLVVHRQLRDELRARRHESEFDWSPAVSADVCTTGVGPQ